MKRAIIFAALGWVVLILSCSRRSDHGPRVASDDNFQSDNPLLAVVGERRITVKDFQAELSRRSRAKQGAYAEEEQRQKLLQEMVKFEVLLAQARAAGYDRNPEIQAKVNEFIVARFQEDQFGKQSVSAPSDAEAREFYHQHHKRFSTSAEARVALIYFKCSSKATDEKREVLKRTAEAVLAEARATDSEGFSRLALHHSDDQSTRYTGGDAGWLRQNVGSSRWDVGVLNAAFALSEPGAFAPLVETADGFYIVRLLEKKPKDVLPFQDVKETIVYQLTQQKQSQHQQDFFEKMKRGLKIEIYSRSAEVSLPV